MRIKHTLSYFQILNEVRKYAPYAKTPAYRNIYQQDWEKPHGWRSVESARDLDCCFVWSSTPQGHTYWKIVNTKIIRRYES